MPTPYDIPPSMLIEKLAEYLKTNTDSVRPPKWAPFVKTGMHKQRNPENPDWWYIRCASLLRKVYVKGPIGIKHLRLVYGGRKDHGVRPEHVKRGSGAIARNALKQLEENGFIESSKTKGRVVTPKGRRLVDMLSTEIKKDLEKEIPELKKY